MHAPQQAISRFADGLNLRPPCKGNDGKDALLLFISESIELAEYHALIFLYATD